MSPEDRRPNFKRLAFQDIKNVFLNDDEFGEYHTLNGKRMLCTVDANEVEARGKKQFEHSRIDGIFEDNMILYVARKDFGQQPARGRQLDFDGEKFIVTDSRDEGGMYSITIQRFRS